MFHRQGLTIYYIYGHDNKHRVDSLACSCIYSVCIKVMQSATVFLLSNAPKRFFGAAQFQSANFIIRRIAPYMTYQLLKMPVGLQVLLKSPSMCKSLDLCKNLSSFPFSIFWFKSSFTIFHVIWVVISQTKKSSNWFQCYTKIYQKIDAYNITLCDAPQCFIRNKITLPLVQGWTLNL